MSTGMVCVHVILLRMSHSMIGWVSVSRSQEHNYDDNNTRSRSRARSYGLQMLFTNLNWIYAYYEVSHMKTPSRFIVILAIAASSSSSIISFSLTQ